MLTHLDSQGRANMVDVTDKAATFRETAASHVCACARKHCA